MLNPLGCGRHLPRIEQVIEPESTLCACGCGEMVKIAEDRSERLNIVPAQLRVIVTVRQKYACRQCARNGADRRLLRPQPAGPAGRGADAGWMLEPCTRNRSGRRGLLQMTSQFIQQDRA